MEAMVQKLADLGHELDLQELLVASKGRTAGRPDVARALVEKGICNSIRQAFDRFLKDGGPAYVPMEKFSLPDALALGQSAGAKMSLAHPHQLKNIAVVEDLFSRFKSERQEGIEAYDGRYGRAQREGWLRMAKNHDLVVTGGSDFHGAVTPSITRLGIELPEPHAQRLGQWLGL